MSETRPKIAGNAPGRFYVNELCIGCTLCHEIAPGNFLTNDEQGVGFVFRQPETPEEEMLCRKAGEACPIDAIQDNGLVNRRIHKGRVV
ncbi:MAG: ferredoxin [Syntrophus sp. (in: bacteria)]|nr:ferredoxin [Syntrophus sp. (in: bacteria)]